MTSTLRLAEVRPVRSSSGGGPVGGWLATPIAPGRGQAATDGRLVVVLHGVLRNAREYLDSWTGWSQATGRPVLAPQFDADRWPRARAYNLGNVLDAAGGGNPRSAWAVTALARLVEDTIRTLRLTDRTWDLFGHSAGAQFAHRFALLGPADRLATVLAAGAGWFTVPDPGVDWPYGTRSDLLGLDDRALLRWTRRPLVLMRGEHDLVRDQHLRTGARADAQGPTRWHRAAHMLAAGRAYDPDCRWQLIDVAGAHHDQQPMAAAAQRWLVDGGGPPSAGRGPAPRRGREV